MGILLANTTNNLDEIVELINNRLVSITQLPVFRYIDETAHSIDDEISIEEIKNALDCNVRVYLYSMDKNSLGKFRAKIFYEIDAAKGLLKLFRTWNFEWDAFALGQTKDKPKSYDKFIEDINDKYVITIKQSIK
jgi:methionine salvage enolase-phosphatase E1